MLEEKDSGEEYDIKYRKTPPFTNEDFVKWRDKWLPDHDWFLVELQGGECSHPKCQDVIFRIIETLGANEKTKFQLQSNGVGDREFYVKLLRYKGLIDRIGFTYHRDELNNVERRGGEECDRLNKVFEDNVELMVNSGINFYIKEILLLQYKEDILKNKKYWESRGVEFRIQDYKTNNGRAVDSPRISMRMTESDRKLIDPEYTHNNSTCGCREIFGEYTNIIIRGYDYYAGDVIACWHNPIPVGNIKDDWYRGGYIIRRDLRGMIEILYEEAPPLLTSTNIKKGDVNVPDEDILSKRSNNDSVLLNQTMDLLGSYTAQNDIVMGQISALEEKIAKLHNEKNNLTIRAVELKGGIDGLTMVVRMGEGEDVSRSISDQELLPVKNSLKKHL